MSNARKLADNLPSEGQLGNRNLIINGAMQIAQRATQSTNASSTGYKTLDRYYHEMKVNTDNFTYTTEQVSDAPSGFSKSFKLTCTTAESVLAADEYGRIYQAIEGNNLERVGFGTADAKPLTLSFWVKSTLTGNFSASLYVNDANVIYSQAYTINAASTWEYKTLTFPAYTTAAPNIDNTAGAYLNFGLYAGSNSNTASTNWATYAQANLLGGQTANLAGTLNATWQITGIQLEVGSQSTPFEHEPYETTLSKCYRYFYTLTGLPNGKHIGSCTMRNNQYFYGYPRSFPTPMRAAPTFTYNNVSLYVGDNTNGYNTMSLAAAETDAFSLNGNAAGAVTAAETGHSGLLYLDVYSDRHVTFDAEL